jgi:putative spermidine/putrescine transport system permease protein
MSRNGPLALAYHTLFVAFMLAPIVVVCGVAFTPEGFLSFPTHTWSLRWFRAISRYPEFVAAFWRSLVLGALSSAISVGFSVPAALAVARHRFRGREAITSLFMSPLMIPHVVLGIAFLRFFTEVGLGGTFAGLVLAHIVIVFPFALRLTIASAVGLDRSIEHAAVSLGASEVTVLKRITLPLVVPGLASGWALAFINSFDEVTMTIFVAAPGTVTLPVRMFLYIQDSIDPLVASVSACVIAVTVVAMMVLDRIHGLERLLVGRNAERGIDGR